jgi:hypothetical protein
MNENWSISRDCVEVVVVVAGNRQVPHPAVAYLRDGAAVGDCDGAVGSFEVLALLQLARADPLLQRRTQNR